MKNTSINVQHTKFQVLLIQNSSLAYPDRFFFFYFQTRRKRVWWTPYIIFVLKISTFGDFMHGFWLMLKDRKGSLIGDSDVITLYCQPGQRLHEPFLSFNTNQKPCIKSTKRRDFEHKTYVEYSPDLSKYKRRKSGLAMWDYQNS